MARISGSGLAVALIAAALLPLTTTRSAVACSCTGVSLQEEIDQTAAVFAGRVDDISERSPSERWLEVEVRFEVSEVWKGDIGSEAVVVNPAQDSACGVNFLEGQTYIVYALAADTRLDTSSCTRTRIGRTLTSEEDAALPNSRLILRPEMRKEVYEIDGGRALMWLGLPLVLAAVGVSAVVWRRAARR
jgi:hypothetical protein